jgi:hypothetical protein
MKVARLLLCACLALAASSALAGTIEGIVVNTSAGKPVPCQVAVILQVQVKGQFVSFRDAVSDQQGHFRFTGLPVDGGVVYEPGATRHGIFYPGPRIRLTERAPRAGAKLSVCDASASPSPLVLKKMDVTIQPETGLLRVTESLLIENPSHTCYVGLAAHDGADPLTLELSIPPDFERTTFDLEFFGRRFAVVNNKVVTTVPWPPGERELKYTYVLRNAQEVSVWRRPIDLPCSNVTIRVEGKPSSEVRCAALQQGQADGKATLFESGGLPLAAGQVLQVEIGRLPLPWMTYGKWAALAIMAGLIAVTGWFHLRGKPRKLPAVETKSPAFGNKRKRAA